MGKKRSWYFDLIPRWLLYSGLPEELYNKLGPHAWPIFQCLIMLDCRFNRDRPGTFDQSFEEIAALVGIKSRTTVWKYIKALERDNRIWARRGKSKRSKSTFKIVSPIKTPKHPKDIHALDGGLLNRKGKTPHLRYAEPVQRLNESNQFKKEDQPVQGTIPTRSKVEHQRELKRGKENYPEREKEAQASPSSLPRGEGDRLLSEEEHLRKSKAFREELKKRLRKKELEERLRLEKRKPREEGI